ncbi:putative rna-binding protein [Golovinomyces cichoracearum]|uniref:Putative rna-binding protein n=1 Tax=Golovinomyces cichoracearum TaxID=62708 RepID=A0A420IAW0_9PEZI|nr:putative rna-binding protein [Golovinomyces cichoracearum]
MSFSKNTSDRIDEFHFRSQKSPRTDSSLIGMVSPPRTSTRQSQPLNFQDSRGNLMRRFTADSGCAPIITPAIIQRNSQDLQEFGPSTYQKVQLVSTTIPRLFQLPISSLLGFMSFFVREEIQLQHDLNLTLVELSPDLEKKKLEYELLREQKRRFEADLQLLDLQQRRDEQELAQMQEDLGRSSNTNQGHQSEPTTPPEYNETPSGFPSAFSRPNRYSASSLASLPGLFNTTGRSGSQITSPSGAIQSRLILDDSILSQPISDLRNTIDENDKAEAVRQDPTSHRSTNALNRYSMPVTKTRFGLREMALDQTNTARFLFGEEETPSSGLSDYLQVNATEENFPILVRREDYPSLLSTSSAALDLALSQPPASESNAWSIYTSRHRPSRSQQGVSLGTAQSSGTGSVSKQNTVESPATVRPTYRHSLDMKYRHGPDLKQESISQVSSSANNQLVTPPKLQQSYSTNETPTIRNLSRGGSTANTGSGSHSQLFHNHNASLGRIPPGALNSILSRDLNSSDNVGLRESQNTGFPSIQSALHASAPPFGPALTQSMNQTPLAAPLSPNSQQSFSVQQPYHSMQMMMTGMHNMSLGPSGYASPNSYSYISNQAFVSARPQQSSSRVAQNRRQNDGDVMNKFANVTLDSLSGEIYALCKDQHGCRFLQKKLEERNPDEIHKIWLETHQHVIEFMTDPFGNYLCQKLLEYCNDEERTILIENASHDLVRIALNQHGTRALQKMIEHISTQGQIETIINALRHQVVELIQDLNGNHVIQKCLNKLSPLDAQFIFDAVGQHCVDVGTHRHGCCVLQRCIDHTDGEQKAWLIRQISNNAYVLVQDPFGNYVVQYILDLNEPIFTEPLVSMFKGRVSQLSRQKFSSNVIEKCLRCAQEPTKNSLIEELLQPNELERLLRDSFANYVIQTALDYANSAMKNRLMEAIRPHLPAIRSTPYGRRIQAKISGNEGRSDSINGQVTPGEPAEPIQKPLRHSRGGSTVSSNGFMASVNGTYVNNFRVSGPGNNSISNRSPPSSGPFPSSEQLATSPTSHQPNSHSYSLGPTGQTADNNWL